MKKPDTQVRVGLTSPFRRRSTPFQKAPRGGSLTCVGCFRISSRSPARLTVFGTPNLSNRRGCPPSQSAVRVGTGIVHRRREPRNTPCPTHSPRLRTHLANGEYALAPTPSQSTGPAPGITRGLPPDKDCRHAAQPRPTQPTCQRGTTRNRPRIGTSISGNDMSTGAPTRGVDVMCRYSDCWVSAPLSPLSTGSTGSSGGTGSSSDSGWGAGSGWGTCVSTGADSTGGA